MRHPGDRLRRGRADLRAGEQAFVDAQPRSAIVAAVTDCAVLRLSPTGIANLQKAEPDLAFQLLHDIARVLSLRLRTRPG